jgi:SAM-dependent methyltransferase
MLLLSKHFRQLNSRYHGPEGDDFALKELNPVAARFLPKDGKVLEVGCGYGRNLVALSRLRSRVVVGCDVALDELKRAKTRLEPIDAVHRSRVQIVRQEPYRLPFRDGTFDLVILWQVVEHLFGAESKRRVVAECIRVLRSGGHILVETPNQWFPFDYHDNKLPLVHWVCPPSVREWLTYKIRGKRYPPSEYVSVPGFTRLLVSSPNVRRVTKATRVYFFPNFGAAWRGMAGSQVVLKKVIFIIAAPLHAVLRLFGQSADLILPSIRVVWRIEKVGSK